MTDPISERHTRFAADFGAVAEQVTDWDAPSPVPEWRAHDVVEHLLDWLPGLVGRWAGVDLAPYEGDDLTARWRRRSADVQALLDDPTLAERPVTEGPFAGQSVAQVLDQLYLTDIYLHTWDLAKAGGVPVPLDPEFAARTLPGMQAIEPMLRQSGQFGTAAHPTSSTDPVDRLMAFIGRDPEFSPAAQD